MPLYTVQNDRLKELGLDSEASPFMPVGSEYKGWREYCELAKQYPNDTRYKSAAADEFKHMLVRLADALAEVKSIASADEKTALVDFLNEVLKEVSK